MSREKGYHLLVGNRTNLAFSYVPDKELPTCVSRDGSCLATLSSVSEMNYGSADYLTPVPDQSAPWTSGRNTQYLDRKVLEF